MPHPKFYHPPRFRNFAYTRDMHKISLYPRSRDERQNPSLAHVPPFLNRLSQTPASWTLSQVHSADDKTPENTFEEC